MDSRVSILLDRADNELLVSKTLASVTENPTIKKTLNIPEQTTFYSSVISHAYYSIFFAARAYLASKGIQLSSEQGIHQQVYFKFRTAVLNGSIEQELLDIYEEIKIKAETLLEILQGEKLKRKAFTYETISQANKFPAEESISNATIFKSHIQTIIESYELEKQNKVEKEE